MDDFFVLVAGEAGQIRYDIADFFEEEEKMCVAQAYFSITNEAEYILKFAEADLVVFCGEPPQRLERYIRICKKWNISYYVVKDVDNTKEFIAEKFLEWSEQHGT